MQIQFIQPYQSEYKIKTTKNMMNSDPLTSFSANDSQQLKYQRALKEIKKVVNANKILKRQNQESRIQMQQRINELEQKLNQVKGRYQSEHKERLELEKYIQQLQDRNSVIRKEHQASEKELSYLNEMIAEQTQELKKLSIFKNQKKIGNIIKTYELKEEQSNNEKIALRNTVKELQHKIEHIYRQTQQDRCAKEKAQQKYFILQKELQTLRELNHSIIQRHQKYIEQLKNSDKTKIKERMLSELIKQFRQQIQNLKQTQKQVTLGVVANQNYEKNFEILIEDKTKLSVQLVNVKNQYQIAQQRVQQSFVIEEKLREATTKAEQLTEQVNMLKSKIVILQTKDIVNEDMAGEDYLSQISESKAIEQKISYLLAQADPLAAIKNGEDSSHFRILSSYIAELRDRLNKAYIQNKDLSHKYKTLCSKRHRHQSSGNSEYDVNILIGKIKSYEKLTEKLQNELQKTIKMNEIQMRRMHRKEIRGSHNEIQQEMNVIKSQIEQTGSRSGQIGTKINDQLYQLKKQLVNKNILIKEKDSKIGELQNYIRIYEQKFQVITSESQRVDKENMRLHNQLMRIKQEAKQLQLKVDTFLLQKQELLQQIQAGNRKHTFASDGDDGSTIYALESRINSLIHQKDIIQREYETVSKQAFLLKKQLQQIRESQQFQISRLQRENQFYKEEQSYYSEAQRKVRDLENELQIAKLRAGKYHSENNIISQLEDQLSRKNDQIVHLKRKLVNYQINFDELNNQRDRLEFDLRLVDKNMGKQQIFEEERRKAKIFESELNNERARNMRLQSELNLEKNRIFNLQSKIRQLQTQIQYMNSSNSLINGEQDHYRVNQFEPSGVRIGSSLQYSENQNNDAYSRVVTTVPVHNSNTIDSWNYQIKGQPRLVQMESYEVKSIDSRRNSQEINNFAKSANINNRTDSQKMRGLEGFQTRTITSVGFYQTPFSGSTSRLHNVSVQRASIDEQAEANQINALNNQVAKSYPSFQQYKASFKYIKEDKQTQQKRLY